VRERQKGRHSPKSENPRDLWTQYTVVPIMLDHYMPQDACFHHVGEFLRVEAMLSPSACLTEACSS